MINAQVNNVLCPKAYPIRLHNVKGLYPLPPIPVTIVRWPSSKSPIARKITVNALKCKQIMPVCRSGGDARVGNGNGNQEPLWKSFGKAFENLGKKSSVEDLLRQQIEKGEFYDEGGNPPGGKGGGSGGGGGGFGGLGGSEEEGFSGIIDETVQVVLATLGFIFLYLYIINGAEMTLIARDYIKFLFTGKKSFRLSRVLEQWESFCGDLAKREPEDKFWLEKAIIRTPTWWDSPKKYKHIVEAYLLMKSGQSNEQENVYDHGSMSDVEF